MGAYAKFIVAAVGGAVSALLAIVPADTNTWNILTVVSLSVTAIGTYLVKNTPTV